MSVATSMALEFANELYAHEKIPVFTYGEASTTKLFLKDIRRELGYFMKVCSACIELWLLYYEEEHVNLATDEHSAVTNRKW